MDEILAEILPEAETFLVVKRSAKLTRSQAADLFNRLKSSRKLTSSFLVCLVARLISLSSVHAYKRLSDVLAELLGSFRFCDAEGYGQWVGKAPSPLLEPIDEIVQPLRALQVAILRTIFYLVCFGDLDWEWEILRIVLKQWDVAAKTREDGHAVELERKVLERATFLMNEKSDEENSEIKEKLKGLIEGFMVGELIDFGEKARPQPVCDPFLYYELLWRNGERNCANKIIEFVIDQLSGEKLEFDQNKEKLYPLLQIFVEVASTAHHVNPSHFFDAYRAIQSYYLWPQPYCTFVRDVLDFIRIESRCPGYHYRKGMIAETAALKFLSDTPREEQIHVLVDQSCSEASLLLDSLKCAPPVNGAEFKKAFMKRIFCSFFGPGETLTEVHQHIEAITSEVLLEKICIEAEYASEDAVQQQSEEKARDLLNEKLESILTTIKEHVANQNLPLFTSGTALPPSFLPAFKCHVVETNKLASSFDIVREIFGDHIDSSHTPQVMSPISESTTSEASNASTSSDNDALVRNNNEALDMRNDSIVSQSSIDTMDDSALPDLSTSPLYTSRSGSDPFPSGNRLRSYYARSGSLPEWMDSASLDALRIRSPKMARRGSSVTAYSVRRKPSLNTCEVVKPLLVKLVVFGDDRIVQSVADCYAKLRKFYVGLMQDVEMRFYYVPVLKGRAESCESDAWLARFLGYFDGWFAHVTVAAVTDSQKILPAIDEGAKNDVESGSICVTSPQALLQSEIAHFCRHAHYDFRLRLYEVKILFPSKGSPATITMLQRIEILAAGQQKRPREFAETTTKPQNICIDASLVTVDGHVHETVSVTDKMFWSITLANVMRPGDSCIANPEMIGFELTLIEAATVQHVLRTTKYIPRDETREVLHVNEVIVSTSNAQAPIRVRIDDAEPMEVQRLEVRPLVGLATRRPSVILPTLPLNLTDDGNNEDVTFSLMTYWPVTL